MSSLRGGLQNIVQPLSTLVKDDQQNVARAQPDLEKRMTYLLAKLIQAQAKLVAYEQPVALTSGE